MVMYGLDAIIHPLTERFERLALRRNAWEAFEDFLALAALSIQNSVELSENCKRHNQETYLLIAGKYRDQPEDLKLHAEIFGELTALAQQSVEAGSLSDFLAPLFCYIALYSKHNGQVFTPPHIADMVAHLSGGEPSGFAADIAQYGYVPFCDPACGSGRKALAAAGVMLSQGFDYTSQLRVDAMDSNLSCVYMTYIQLSVYGIPGKVRHMDSLACGSASATWRTPQYVAGGWLLKERIVRND